MKHLRYDIYGAHLNHKETRHPQEVMLELGITYEQAVPQSICDQWWFLGCENIPNEVPDFLSEIKPTGDKRG